MQPSWLDNKGGKYVLNDSKVNIIKSIFKHYLSGYGCVTIAKRLNREQAPVVVNAYKNRSNIWHPYQITRLLNNKALIGFYKTGINSEVGEYFPKAIPETDFYAVQAKLKENSKFKGQRNSSPYIFSHLIKCAFCGRTMFRTLEKGRSYLQCMGNKEGNCKAAYMHYAFLEKALLLVVGSQTVDLNDDNEVAAKKEIDEIKGRVAEITNKIKVASAMVAKRPSDAGFAIIQQLEESKIKLEMDLANISNLKHLADSRKHWNVAKMLALRQINAKLKDRGVPLKVGIKENEDGTIEFVEHESVTSSNSVLALREAMRSCLKQINVNTLEMKAFIEFKSGKKVDVEFKKSNTYPRRYFYKTIGTDWNEIITA